jgi:hypothetical protein
MRLKNIVRVIVLLPLTLYCIYSVGYFITQEASPTFVDCGRLISKSNDEVAIKHGTKTELYLNIQFEKSGFKSIPATPTTYFSKHKGDYVCFNLMDTEIVTAQHVLTFYFGATICLVIACFSVVWLFGYIAPESWG